MKLLVTPLFIFLFFTQCFSQTLQWKKILSANSGQRFVSVAADSGIDHVFASGSNSSFYISVNKGNSFKDHSHNCGNLISFLFPGGNTIMAGTSSAQGPCISTDNGFNWDFLQGIGYINALTRDRRTIWGASKYGSIIKSVDGGKTWDLKWQVIPGSIISIAADSPFVYLGTKNSFYYRSTDYGSTWTKAGNLTGNGCIIMDKQKVLWMISGSSLYYSDDRGLSWKMKKQFVVPVYLTLDKSDRLYCTDSLAGLYRSCDRGSSWELIANFRPNCLAFQDSIIYASDDLSVYRYPSEISVENKPFVFPLSARNKYQYLKSYTPDKCSNTIYSIEKWSVSEFIADGKKYHKFSNSDFAYRFDKDSSLLYIRKNSEHLYYNFSLPEGANFIRYSPYSNTPESTSTKPGIWYSFGKTRKIFTDQITKLAGVGIRTTFTDDIGPTNISETSFYGTGYYSISWSLIDAIIYDENGNPTYHGRKDKPVIKAVPFNTVSGHESKIPFSCQITHTYSYNQNDLTEDLETVVFIDSVSLEYYYQKDQINSDIYSVPGKRSGNDMYNFTIPADTLLIQQGYSIMYRIKAQDRFLIPNHASSPESGYYKAVYDPLAEVAELKGNSHSFALNQNYPNPFNPATKISYSIAKTGNVKLAVYNSLGQMVKLLVDGEKEPGRYSIQFNGNELSSGVYYCRLTSGNSYLTMKMLLIK